MSLHIAVVSDSHGYKPGLRLIAEQVWQRWGRVDAWLHCGDGAADIKAVEPFLRAHDPETRIWQVRGNCDGYTGAEIPWERVVTLGGVNLFMTHGHLFGVKYSLAMLDEEAHAGGCAIALFGHTHEPCMEMRSTLLLNPGCAHTGQYLLLELEDGRPRVHLETLDG